MNYTFKDLIDKLQENEKEIKQNLYLLNASINNIKQEIDIIKKDIKSINENHLELRNKLNVLSDPIIEVENGGKIHILQSDLLKELYKAAYPILIFYKLFGWLYNYKNLIIFIMVLILSILGINEIIKYLSILISIK